METDDKVSAGDIITGTFKGSYESSKLWFISKEGGGTYYDVLCPFDEAPKETKIGDTLILPTMERLQNVSYHDFRAKYPQGNLRLGFSLNHYVLLIDIPVCFHNIFFKKRKYSAHIVYQYYVYVILYNMQSSTPQHL